jgi:hypothetical protein
MGAAAITRTAMVWFLGVVLVVAVRRQYLKRIFPHLEMRIGKECLI